MDTIATSVFAQSLQTPHAHSPWWEEEPYWFWVTGSKVKVNFGTLCIRPCGHDTDYSFCPITYKLHMHIHHDVRRNPIDFGSRVKGQGQLCPPARGCHALHCLVLCYLHVCKWKNAYIKDLNALWILMNFLCIYLGEKGGCTIACICIGTHSQPLLQNRLMDVYKTW